MGTLAEHEAEYKSGLVSRGGFNALMDAENYGHISSIGALEQHLRILYSVIFSGRALEVDSPGKEIFAISNSEEFQKWCTENFPTASFQKVCQC